MNCPHCSASNVDGARFCGGCGQAMLATSSVPDARIAEPPSLIGREIAGRFRVLAKLGEGGMGAVYRAEQISLKRTVAVKLLRPEVASSALLLRRFNAEAELVAKLNHPNTVGIYDFGQDTDGTLFISMEFIEGQSLRTVVHQESPLHPSRALAIAQQISASLIDAHSHGIVHRDLKPDNVMLQERGRQRDVVRVLDFGIAKLRDDSRQSQMAMTQAGDMLGTPQYMAPEQIRAEEIDGRTDVYALGCLLYEMITARLPFEAPTVMALLSKHLLEPPVPPSQRRPDLVISRELDDLILAAMAKLPSARPQTMEQYAEQIAHVASITPPDPNAPPPATGNRLQGIPPSSPHHAAVRTPAPSHPSPAPQLPAVQSPPHPAPPYAAPGAQQAYSPFPPPAPQSQPHPAPPSKSSKTAIWVVLAVLVLCGGGVLAFVLTRHPGATSPTTVATPTDDHAVVPASPDDPWARQPTAPGPDAAAPDAEADAEADEDGEDLAADPLAGAGDLDTDLAAAMAQLGSSGGLTSLPAGADLRAADDYTRAAGAGVVQLAANDHSVALVMMNASGAGAAYARTPGAFQITSHGKRRWVVKTGAGGQSMTLVIFDDKGYDIVVMLTEPAGSSYTKSELEQVLDDLVMLPGESS